MQQETPSGRKPYLNLFPLALAVAVSLAACDGARVEQAQGPVSPRTPREVAAPVTRAAVEAPAVPLAQTPSPEALTDTVISGKIRSAIVADPGMAGTDISVNTDRGVVLLAGLVRTPEQTAIASAHAQRQDGVMRVDNHLTVPPT